jgi:thiol-disulfide isomerase/thioredoxin
MPCQTVRAVVSETHLPFPTCRTGPRTPGGAYDPGVSANSPYKPLRGLFIILVAVTAAVVIFKGAFARDRVPWRTDLAAAAQEAQRDGKPQLLYFTATWCGPCQRMTPQTWSDETVERRLREVVPTKVDIDRHAELAERYDVAAVPTFIVLDAGGNVVKRTDGFMGAGAFLGWLGG